MSFALSLKASQLSLARGGRVLFEDLSFEVKPGALVALTGPNGAGKTSLLRALAGLLPPLSGRIEAVDGGVPLHADDRISALHLLSHRDGLKGPISARAHACYWRDLFGGAGRVDAALARVGLTHAADRAARTLSAGQSRRLALTRLLLAPRPIWLLDEPAAALDRTGKDLLDGLIGEHRAKGGAVIAALHEPLGAPPSQTLALA